MKYLRYHTRIVTYGLVSFQCFNDIVRRQLLSPNQIFLLGELNHFVSIICRISMSRVLIALMHRIHTYIYISTIFLGRRKYTMKILADNRGRGRSTSASVIINIVKTNNHSPRIIYSDMPPVNGYTAPGTTILTLQVNYTVYMIVCLYGSAVSAWICLNYCIWGFYFVRCTIGN